MCIRDSYGRAAGTNSLAVSGWWNPNSNADRDANEIARAEGTSSVAVGAGVSAYDNYSVAMGVGLSLIHI